MDALRSIKWLDVECIIKAILMSIQNIHFHDEISKMPEIFIYICFIDVLEKFLRDSKNDSELATVNEPSTFESLRFYCISWKENQWKSLSCNCFTNYFASEQSFSTRRMWLKAQRVPVIRVDETCSYAVWLIILIFISRIQHQIISKNAYIILTPLNPTFI